MQVATIVPQSYLKLTQGDTYHMALAHLIGMPGMEKYTNHMRDMGSARPGNWVILDNGLIETGYPMPIDGLVLRAMTINADEIILPDVFRNKDATLQAITDAFQYLDRFSYGDEFSFMAIPQGETLEEWVECAHVIMEVFTKEAKGRGAFVSTLGIPKVLVDIAGRDGRLIAIDALQEADPDIKLKIDFHLLGCWKTPIEVMTLDKASLQGIIPPIRGVDSVLPYVYARAGMTFSCGDRPDSDAINFMDGQLAQSEEVLLKYNIQAWRDAGDMSEEKAVIFVL